MNDQKYTLQISAIVLISAGYGWSGGHFIPTTSPWFAYLFQLIIFFILLILSLGFFKGGRKWSIIGLNIFTILSLLINVGNIVHGALNHTPGGFGSHNTFADLVPISIIILGTLLWLISVCLPNKPEKRTL